MEYTLPLPVKRANRLQRHGLSITTPHLPHHCTRGCAPLSACHITSRTRAHYHAARASRAPLYHLRCGTGFPATGTGLRGNIRGTRGHYRDNARATRLPSRTFLPPHQHLHTAQHTHFTPRTPHTRAHTTADAHTGDGRQPRTGRPHSIPGCYIRSHSLDCRRRRGFVSPLRAHAGYLIT